MDWKLAAQGVNLLGCIAYHLTFAFLSLPWTLLYYLGFRRRTGYGDVGGSVVFYEGLVTHTRRAPKVNTFRYAVRMAVLDLDSPPAWFSKQAEDHMTADQARKFAGTEGRVRLLTDPLTAGYIQNPIAVYYCYGPGDATLQRCIAEVTNTPWGERVTFVFDPKGQAVHKALHVSPFMDMQNTWHLLAPDPGPSLKLVVKASHPEYGNYFHADLIGLRSSKPGHINEEAGLGALLRYGFMPHRVALLIYWQAVKLLWKGVPFYMPPDKRYQQDLLQQQPQLQPATGNGSNAVGGCPAAARSNGVTVANGSQHYHANATPNGTGPEALAVNGNGGGDHTIEPEAGPAAAAVAAASGCGCPALRHSHPVNGVDGKHFMWREAAAWPWKD